MRTNVTNKVRKFYEELPFNYRSSLKNHIEKIKQNNPIEIYPCLKGLLNKQITHIDIGCGAGWFVNSLNYNYDVKSTGIDFSKKSISRAIQISKKMKLDTKFINKDFLTYDNKKKFYFVSSIGVLHHTKDCLHSIKIITKKYLKKNGYFFLGLYHKFSRKPFLDHFQKLRDKKVKNKILFKKFKNLRSGSDKVNDLSWFRDQVLHPHETQHSFEEIYQCLKKNNLKVISTSINKFKKISSIRKIFTIEKRFEKIATEKIKNGIYFPGFFVVLSKKK